MIEPRGFNLRTSDMAGDTGWPYLGQEHSVDQVGQWTLIWWRFSQHRMAMLGGWVLLAVVLFSTLGPLVAPPLVQPDRFGQLPLSAYKRANMPPQLHWPYLLGTDSIGNPVLHNVLVGGWPMLCIGALGSLLALLLGMAVGAAAGYLGGIVDIVLMRLVDATLAIPFLLLLVILNQSVSDRGVLMTIALFGLAGWPGIARLVRGYMLSFREREYALAARALGLSSPGVILRHLLPNTLDVLAVSFTLNVGIFIATEATLGFLGAGTSAEIWGVGAGFETILGNTWWLWAFTGGLILLTVIAVNFVGDGLRDALDVTSPTALLVARPHRPIGALMWAAVGAGAMPLVHAIRWLAATPGEMRGPAGAVVPPALRRAVRERPRHRAVPYPHIPLPVGVLPIVGVFLAVGLVGLIQHSPQRYDPTFDAPRAVMTLYSQEAYGALPTQQGWAILAVVPGQRLEYREVGADGRTLARRVLGPGEDGAQPSLARQGTRMLGVWIANGETLRAAYLGPGPTWPFTLTPAGGSVEHPDVVAVPHGFDVLFSWRRPGHTAYDLYLASLHAGSRRTTLRRLEPGHDHALNPRAARDGSGALDVVYLDRGPNEDWQILLRRFTTAGRPLGVSFLPGLPPTRFHQLPLGRVDYVIPGPGGSCDPDAVLPQWALYLTGTPDGSVWIAWEDGELVKPCGNGTGQIDLRIEVRPVDRGGAYLQPTRPIVPLVEPTSLALALTHDRQGSLLFYPQAGQVEPYLESTRFNEDAVADSSQRIAYDLRGLAAQPVAGSRHGHAAVLWEQVRADSTVLETTAWHPARPPDLLTRLGLNLGNLWGNIALVLLGSLGGAVLVTVINLYLLLPLIVLWLFIAHLRRLRWWLLLAGLAVLLGSLFAVPASPPGYVMAISALGFPYGWIVVAGAVFTAGWTGRFLAVRQEAPLRVTAMAILALYFVAVMDAVIFIQGQLNQV